MGDFSGKTVLLIDDSEVTAKILQRFFEDLEFIFHHASNGIFGLKKALTVRPELILCDVEMPYKNGIDFLRDKNNRSEIINTPTIMLTSRSNPDLVKEAISLGAVDYLLKPFDLEKLLNRLRNIFRVDKSVASGETKIKAYYDSGIIFINVNGSLLPENLFFLKYKVIELINLYQIKEVKLYFVLNDVVSPSVNVDSVNALLKVTFDKDVHIKKENIAIFCEDFEFSQAFKKSEFNEKILITKEYLDGVRMLKFDPNNFQTINVSELLETKSTIVDLYDKKGNIIIPANTKINSQLKDKLINKGIQSLLLNKEAAAQRKKGEPKKIENEFICFEEQIIQNKIAEQKSVLFVEDAKFLRLNVAKYLEKLGFIVYHAENGLEALEKAANEKPDLVLLDIVLPKMNGIEFLQKFRQINKDASVVIMTDLTINNVILKVKNLDVSGFISKPFKLIELLKKIFEVLNPAIKN